MRILSSNVALASSQINTSISTVEEHLRKWDSGSDQTYSSKRINGVITAESFEKRDSVQFSRPRPVADIFPKNIPQHAHHKQNDSPHYLDDEFVGDIKAQIMKDIIEMFTGREIEVLDPGDLKSYKTDDVPSPDDRAAENRASQREGWGIDYQYRETHYTKEGVSFTAAGSVTTADGRAINFKAALEMSRESYEEMNISLKAGDALKDPLVIDLDGKGAGFSSVKFAFDIDADGKEDLLYTPQAETAFLAYDKNGNGIIDNGTELFGPESGNGFSELALLDEDNNGWIDEGDSAFNRLSVWEKAGDGTDYITPLLERGIGALYTGSAKTEFLINTAANELAGVLKESGVYLRENGGNGVIQEVDVVV